MNSASHHDNLQQLLLPPAPAKSPITHDSAPDSAVHVITLPPAGLLLYRRALICLLIVIGMSSIPILGVWYFFGYQGLMPGPDTTALVQTAPPPSANQSESATAPPPTPAQPATDPATAAVAATDSEADPEMPPWYPLMMAVSLSFISLIFLFAAWVFAVEGLHSLFGHTRLTVYRDGIDLHRPLWGYRIRVGERSLPAGTITEIVARPDTADSLGSILITADGYRYHIGEQLRQKDRDWLAEVVRLITGVGDGGGADAAQGSISDSASSKVPAGSTVNSDG